MLNKTCSFSELQQDFSWNIPEHYNIGVDVCDKWADRQPERLAVIEHLADAEPRRITFGALKEQSNRLANALQRLGVRGAEPDGMPDRVGVLLPQSIETAVSHIAITKMGAISIPLFTLFGTEALLHRLRDSEAKAVITNAEEAEKILAVQSELPKLKAVLSVNDRCKSGVLSFHQLCDKESDRFEPATTRADDPALLIYTSGTTGNPKGALHAHRVLLGHLPGVEVSHDFVDRDKDFFWTPADWAWIGGLLDVLMPALHHGVPVLAHRFEKFNPAMAFRLMRDYRIRNVFLPPTALKLMKQVPEEDIVECSLRSIASGGETLGSELLAWGKRVFGVTINEFYGQTECNMIVSCCGALESPKAGYMGRGVVGHRVEIIDSERAEILADGQEGVIAVRAPDPVMFLGYWNNPKATEEKFVVVKGEKWLLTGDMGLRDPDGRIRFIGRDDDVINFAGYRIGPAEIENCLISHPAVRLAGVVGKPDDIRGQIISAYIVLADGYAGSASLAEEIAAHVKSRLAAYEYPRAIRFIEKMPMTTTGKIIRASLRKMAEEEGESASFDDGKGWNSTIGGGIGRNFGCNS
ncbi:MAG: AMP-binding protein [Hyphomicrobiales bacterium]|nr:AMP-binding protein [Hyphomicrobiales bacterium]